MAVSIMGSTEEVCTDRSNASTSITSTSHTFSHCFGLVGWVYAPTLPFYLPYSWTCAHAAQHSFHTAVSRMWILHGVYLSLCVHEISHAIGEDSLFFIAETAAISFTFYSHDDA